MDNLGSLNPFGAVKQLGNKLAAIGPFGKQSEDATASSGDASTVPSDNVTQPTTNPEVESSQSAGDSKDSQSASSMANASALFNQSFNSVRNFGSKLGGLIAQSSVTAAEVGQEKEASALQPTEVTEANEGENADETATDKLKTLGTSLFSYGKQAGQSVFKSTSGALTQIKKTMEEKTPIIADFSKEQERFVEEKRQNQANGPASAPWCGAAGGPEAEEQLRVKILELSTDERNVLRPVPAGQTFDFDMRAHSGLAQLMLSLDPRLDSLRFKFVPKRITEENFWRNYFYRVSLLKQTTDLMSSANNAVASAQSNTMTVASSSPSTESADDQNPDFQEELERAVQQELNEYELVGGAGDDVVDESERSLEAEILAEIGGANPSLK